MAVFVKSSLVFLLTVLFIKLSTTWIPNRLLPYSRERIPMMGGVAMLLALLVMLPTLEMPANFYTGFLPGALLLVFVGVMDDHYPLSPCFRLIIEMLSVLNMCVWGTSLQSLGSIFSKAPVLLHHFAIPFTVFATVGLINAINMSDGVDGLAGSLAMEALIIFCCLADAIGRIVQTHILLFFIASLCAFLLFNFPLRRRASLFLGDSGSMLLGFTLAWFSITLSQGENAVPPVLILWILAMPLFDSLTVIIRRLSHQQSPFLGGQDHLHHLLLQYGLNQRQICYAAVLKMALFSTVGILGLCWGLRESTLFFLWLITWAIYVFFFDRAWLLSRCS